MLSKLIGGVALLLVSTYSPAVDAHRNHRPHRVVVTPTVTVTLGWTWVSPAPLRAGHWNHPYYGRSFRTLTDGPPPRRPNTHAVWVPGHWERRGRHRVWIPGHWVTR